MPNEDVSPWVASVVLIMEAARILIVFIDAFVTSSTGITGGNRAKFNMINGILDD